MHCLCMITMGTLQLGVCIAGDTSYCHIYSHALTYIPISFDIRVCALIHLHKHTYCIDIIYENIVLLFLL